MPLLLLQETRQPRRPRQPRGRSCRQKSQACDSAWPSTRQGCSRSWTLLSRCAFFKASAGLAHTVLQFCHAHSVRKFKHGMVLNPHTLGMPPSLVCWQHCATHAGQGKPCNNSPHVPAACACSKCSCCWMLSMWLMWLAQGLSRPRRCAACVQGIA